MKREPLSVRYDKLLAIARKMAREYDRLCETMHDYYGCEGCPLNTEDMDGGSCAWYGDLYKRMDALGVLDECFPYPLAFVMRCRVREALATRSMVSANTERIIRQKSKTREGEQVFPSLSYEGDHMDDPGYVDYNDQRLVPPDVNDTEEEDMPLTAELREILDLLDVDYSCG